MGDDVVYMPMPQQQMPPQMQMPSDRSDLIERIKPEVIVEIIRNKLLGKEFRSGKWVDIPALADKKLTEIGAWELSNLMLGASTISVSISKLTDREIKTRLLRIVKTAQYMIVENWAEYGIKNVAQQYYVHEIIFTNTLVVLKQADNASIQELLKGTIHEQRNVSTERLEKGGRLKRLLGMG